MNTSAGNSQHYVGNDIINTGATLGLYTITGNDHFQYGNRRKNASTIVPSGTDNLTRTSYYLCAKPAFWNAVLYSWPTIGIPYEFKTGENPASTRWKAGGTTVYNIDLRIKNTNSGVNWYQDNDNDTYGNSAITIVACNQPAGYVANNQDCDDTKATINPTTIWYEDNDGDKYSTGNTQTACIRPSGYILASERLATSIDCNDNDAAINPGATEICDGKDNNCNSNIDELGLTTWYQDNDNDTYGNPAVTIVACNKPTGYVANNQDCDDTKANINPTTIWYEDNDGDKYSTGNTQTACIRPSGYIIASERLSEEIDCNDYEASIYPNATEVANDGIDQDCKDGDLISTNIKNQTVFGLNIFPNPSEGNFIVQCNIAEKGNYTLRISDIQGRIISENEMFFNYGNQQVQVHILQKGFYLLQLENLDWKSIQKIIIK
jgi:hypothetical protein